MTAYRSGLHQWPRAVFALRDKITHTLTMRSSITSLPPQLIHAFTGPNCAGNPAWVVPVQPTADIHATATQYLARPGATACALLLPTTHRNSSITLRSFGPSGEIQLCGHALLCAAHWLWSLGKQEPLHFDLPACQQHIRATRLRDETCLALPSNNYRLCNPPEGLAALIGQRILRCARSTSLPGSLIVELHSESAVQDVQLNATALMQLTTDCVLITARSYRPGIKYNPDVRSGKNNVVVCGYLPESESQRHLLLAAING